MVLIYMSLAQRLTVAKRRCEKLKINCLNSIENKGSIIKSILKSKLLKKMQHF